MEANRTFVVSILTLLIFVSCGSRASDGKIGQKNETVAVPAEVEKNIITAILPKGGSRYAVGDKIGISFSVSEPFDSAALFLYGMRTNLRLADSSAFVVPTTEESALGVVPYRVEVYHNGHVSSSGASYMLLAKDAPKEFEVDVIARLPHSTKAYTQGLEFYNSELIESSGEYGKSYIHRLEFPTLKELKRTSLEDKYFSEGITILNNELYMLTWQERECIVYNPATLQEKRRYSYNTEGWGLANDGKLLYMSDGTKNIYVIDPNGFNVIRRIEVVTNEGPIELLNELEWIDGKIWANVYGYDVILIINPVSGKVEAIIRAPNLLKSGEIKANTDVLNGIAYNKKSGKIYITGKNWATLFEVKLKER